MSYQIPNRFTPEQAKAILYEGNNVLVSAAAGCGKTTLMIERIIRKILNDKINIDEIIVVTFTEAAAAELKERLEVALNNNFNTDPDFISKQLSLLNDAYISTFHSLCLRLLKENGVIFNYENKIQVGDGLQIKSLKEQAYQLLEQRYINDSDYLAVREPFSTPVNSTDFFDLLNNTLELCITKGSIRSFLDYHQNLDLPASIFTYPNFSEIQLEASTVTIDNIVKLLNDSTDSYNSDSINLQIQEHLTFFNDLKQLVENYEYSTIHDKLQSYKLFSKPRETKANSNEAIRRNHEIIKKEIEKNLKPLYELSNDEYLTIIKQNNINIIKLLKYVKIYQEILDSLKQQSGLLEYNDLEQEALKLLYDGDKESSTALKLKQSFNEIMIDEYQDTNIIQEKIVTALANTKNTFMVGDLKQSIYRFRNATPQLFVEKYERYQDGIAGIVIDLSYNFRSKETVLETTNFIFKNTFSKNIGGIDYNDKNQLYFKNAELNKLIGDFQTKLFFNVISSEDKLNKDKSYQLTANTIVEEIKKLINQGVDYREITILFKQRNRSEILTRLLDQANIPYMMHDNKGFYTSYEIRDLISMLKFLVKKDDISLIAILRSYFFNLNEDDLVNISKEAGITFFQKFKNSKYTTEILIIDELINYAKSNHPVELINHIYEITKYLNYISNHYNYEQFLINLTTFKQLISNNFNYYHSLEYLIDELSYNIVKNFDSARPAVLSSRDNVVNIMTIHKSKGLEFNYVFLFDESDTNFDTNTSNNSINNLNNQLVLKYFDSKQKVFATNPLEKLIAFTNKKEVLAEDLRVLYVALTRAKYQLYIFTSLKEKKYNEIINQVKNEEHWLLNESIILNTTSMLQPLIYSFIRHKDGVSLRDGDNILAPQSVYNYNEHLFTCQPYAIENPDFSKQTLKQTNYNIKYVTTMNRESTEIENISPSKHSGSYLDFNNIRDFNTFSQGNKVHKVLELLDFTSNNILEELKLLKDKYQIYQRNYEGIIAFINNDFFKEIITNQFFKEYSFSYLNNDELVTGIIDLYVSTPSMIYIIDYKTDNISKEELKNTYALQLHKYKEVISQTTDLNIKALIYSLANKEFIEV